MRKLVIQIPCWNEELNISNTINQIPRSFNGIEIVEILIIDDGSTDETITKAKTAGAHHILRLPKHVGLARAFEAGIAKSLSLGADIIVNTDADNQYEAKDIKKLIQPILEDEADFVVGDRLASKLAFLPKWKRFLYFCADWVVSLLIGAHSPDPTSGFRAFHSHFAKNIRLKDKHSYTLETLVQAYFSDQRVMFVPVKSRLVNRPSRLIKNIPVYIFKTAFSLFRSHFIYRLVVPATTIPELVKT
jgi:glycosyltransferase involved in cell wall biosynthesis